jgi:hypothetical protein
VHAFERQAGVGQPLGQLRNRRGVVVIEVTSRGEQFDRLEPVSRYFGQVVPFEPAIVVQVRGNAKPHGLRRSDAANQQV